VDARSALFDLYGDHLRSRGGRAPIAALVRLLTPLGVSAPAVRTAVSRMARQGWLEPVRMPEGAGYALTSRANRRLDEAAGRIYRRGGLDWDGRWHLIVTERTRERSRRERLRAGLSYLGYAPLDECTWISPRRSTELDALLDGERIRVQQFISEYEGDDRGLAARAWDLDGLARSYRRWLDMAEDVLAPAGVDPADETAFAVRSRFVHEWRKFLFSDPELPAQLLPGDWPGRKAAELFDAEAGRLLPPAARFVERCLRTGTGLETS
jgi:phenylacetic acid degradation operon negative regulatory protein